MTDQKLDPEEAARIARELLEKSTERRVDAVRSLVASANALDAAEQGVKDARDAHGKAWADALTSGWNDKDLRATGARPPVKAGAAPRARRSSRPIGEHASGGGNE